MGNSTWEYRWVALEWKPSKGFKRSTVFADTVAWTEIQTELFNELGSEGWELVTANPVIRGIPDMAYSEEWLACFKRPIS